MYSVDVISTKQHNSYAGLTENLKFPPNNKGEPFKSDCSLAVVNFVVSREEKDPINNQQNNWGKEEFRAIVRHYCNRSSNSSLIV